MEKARKHGNCEGEIVDVEEHVSVTPSRSVRVQLNYKCKTKGIGMGSRG